MERTEGMLRMAMLSLPPPPESTIYFGDPGGPDGGGAADAGGSGAGGGGALHEGGSASGGPSGGAAGEGGSASRGLSGGAADEGGLADLTADKGDRAARGLGGAGARGPPSRGATDDGGSASRGLSCGPVDESGRGLDGGAAYQCLRGVVDGGPADKGGRGVVGLEGGAAAKGGGARSQCGRSAGGPGGGAADKGDRGRAAARGLSGGAAEEMGIGTSTKGGGATSQFGRSAGGPDGGATDKGGRGRAVARGLGGGTSDDGAAEEMDIGAAAGVRVAGEAADDAEGAGLAGGQLYGHGHNYHEYVQSSDLYLYGRPLSEYWERVWKGDPLILYDKELVEASRLIHGEVGGVAGSSDVTDQMTRILRNHPGPIQEFRIDCSAWTGDKDQLCAWLSTLSTKRVEQLVIINSTLPTNVPFPISNLQSLALRSLSLAFMDIPDLGLASFEYSSLMELYLFGCTFDGQGLSAVISECSCLRKLLIGGAIDSISVTSQSLLAIHMLCSTADTFTIQYAPKLRILATGIRPSMDGQSVQVDINGSDALREIYYWMLPHHTISIRSASKAEGPNCLCSVMKLRLGLAMADPHQISGFVRLLRRLPYLRDLGIWRMDEVNPAEGSNGSELIAVGSVSCVRFCLRYLLMEDFLGGLEEIAAVSHVLGNAQNLLQVSIVPKVMSKEEASLVAFELQTCPRAIGCEVVFHSPKESVGDLTLQKGSSSTKES